MFDATYPSNDDRVDGKGSGKPADQIYIAPNPPWLGGMTSGMTVAFSTYASSGATNAGGKLLVRVH